MAFVHENENDLLFRIKMKQMSEFFTIGVDFGGTNLRVGAYAGTSELLDVISLPTRLELGRDQVVRDMCGAIQSLMTKYEGSRRLAGIGIGSPGPLELPHGVLRNPPNLPGWDQFDLRQAVETALGQEVVLESDANAAALAEQVWGAGRTFGVDTLCMLTLGTGVGNGLIFDGTIWHGHTGMGGEGGHILIKEYDGAPCGCGGYGCLEQYASATAILRMARERMGADAPSDAHGVYLAAVRGDERALQVFAEVGHALAVALTALVNTLNMPLYTIGGGACEAWELFAPVMFEELRRRSYVYRLTAPDALAPDVLTPQKTYILQAELGSGAGLLGACLLPLQKNKNARAVAEPVAAD